MKSFAKGLLVLGFFFVLAAAAILLVPEFQQSPFALAWWISTSFLLGVALLAVGAHLWSKEGPRGAS